MRIIFFLFFLLISIESFAQQTIFNVPSADITKKDKNFIQHESQFRTKDPDKFLTTTNYFARGVGHNTEVDATFFNIGTPSSDNASLAIGFKSIIELKIKNFQEYRPKIIFGFMAPFSLQGNGIGNWAYISNSIFIPQTGTRITAGVSSGTKQIFGESVLCFIGGLEQRITDDFSLISDWYSGNHSLGILAFGISYNLPKSFMFFGGYQIPNSKQVGRNAFIVEIARIF